LTASAHPASEIWRYVPFTDGQETCDGNPAAAIGRIEGAIAAHNGEADEPEDEPPPPVAEEEDEPETDCHPARWVRYRVDIRDGGLHLDTIRLVELRYLERALPNGRCIVRYSEVTYGVMYGSVSGSGGLGRYLWRLNGRPSDTRVDIATSRDGQAAVDALRARARSAGEQGSGKAEAQSAIDASVRENVDAG